MKEVAGALLFRSSTSVHVHDTLTLSYPHITLQTIPPFGILPSLGPWGDSASSQMGMWLCHDTLRNPEVSNIHPETTLLHVATLCYTFSSGTLAPHSGGCSVCVRVRTLQLKPASTFKLVAGCQSVWN